MNCNNKINILYKLLLDLYVCRSPKISNFIFNISGIFMAVYKFKKGSTIGNLDAENDGFLESCFYRSDIYDKILSFDQDGDFTKRIIVGRTGSGKTALLKKVVTDGKVKRHDNIEAESTVFEHINNNVFISGLISSGVDLRVFYKSLWLHVLLVKVIELLYPSGSSGFSDFLSDLVSSSKKKYNLDLARSYVSDYKDQFFNDNVVSEISNKMQGDLSSTLKLAGVSSGSKYSEELTEKIQTETARYVSRELLKKQKELIKLIKEESSDEKQVRIIIGVDDLDKSWLSSSNIRYDFINALLDAFKELIDVRSVKVLISIRTDIIMGVYNNNLRQEEKDKSLILPISWSVVEIREILDSRIDYLIKNQYRRSDTVGLVDIFDFTVNGISADDFIISRTMLRPRDAIDFVNLCLDEADGSTELNEDIVLAAEEKFYASRKKAMVKEWVSIFPRVSDYLDSISFIPEKSFSASGLGEIKEKISNYLVSLSDSNDDKKHETIALEFEALLKVWFTIGVVGIKKSSTLVIYSSFDKPELDITDLNREFCIHPLYYRY